MDKVPINIRLDVGPNGCDQKTFCIDKNYSNRNWKRDYNYQLFLVCHAQYSRVVVENLFVVCAAYIDNRVVENNSVENGLFLFLGF